MFAHRNRRERKVTANILFLIRSGWDGINIKSLIFSFVIKENKNKKTVGEVPDYGIWVIRTSGP